MIRAWCVAALCLAGCRKAEQEPLPGLMDTGWFNDTAILDPELCPHKLVDTWPPDGVRGWYWRDRPQAWVATDHADRYAVTLTDDSGVRLTSQVDWSPDGLSFQPAYDGHLKPDTTYTLNIRDCADRNTVEFRTSDYGRPFYGSANELVGNTYYLDLAGARWMEPGGIAALLQLYFTTPVLLGVVYASKTQVDFIGGLGELDQFGTLRQDLAETTWDFPLSDFTEQPYFQADSANVVLVVDGVDIPVEQFRFDATFSADMGRIGGGQLQGLADTRNMGELLNQKGVLDAVCSFAASVGVQCQACSDGEPYCLFMKAIDVGGTRVPGLTMTPRP